MSAVIREKNLVRDTLIRSAFLDSFSFFLKKKKVGAHTTRAAARTYKKTFIARRRLYEAEYRMMRSIDQSQAL